MPDDKPQPENGVDLENNEEDQGELSDAAAAGFYEVCMAVADLLRNTKFTESVAALVESRAHRAKNPTPYYVSLCFGLLVFAGIGLLAWHKVLTTESTTVLIGALIAAWWGGQRPQK